MQDPKNFKDFQILGASVRVIMDGFGAFTLLASRILLEHGLGTEDAGGLGLAVIDPDRWYPLDGFLQAFQRIGTEFSDLVLRKAGIHINKQASDPGDILKNINSTFMYLDQGYHFNHARNGKPMFNPETGQMMEGIGHFACRPFSDPPPGKQQVTLVVDTPYPCAFDEGIVIGMAQRFDPTATVTHDPKACRQKGAAACNYHVIWT
jgi:hypothetical protein